MLKTKQIKIIRALSLLAVIAGFLYCSSGCLEKEELPGSVGIYGQQTDPFAIFKIHLKLIDADTQEPLSDVRAKIVFNATPSFNPPTAEQVTDTLGVALLVFPAAPLVPKEFWLSLSDTTQIRRFQQEVISVLFTAPVFAYIPGDAAIWGTKYQGTAELVVSREINQIYNDEK